MISNGIACVAAVPVHRQSILINLITDGERGVFSPVPLTVSTTNLHTQHTSDTVRFFVIHKFSVELYLQYTDSIFTFCWKYNVNVVLAFSNILRIA